MKATKAQVGDYVPWMCELSRIVDIKEIDGVVLYVLDTGAELTAHDFKQEDIRLESEVFG